MISKDSYVIALTGLFIISLAMADLAATKFILLGTIAAPGGIFLFSTIFVVRDALHKIAGETYVKKVILIAAALNIFVAAYFYFITHIPAPSFAENVSSWNQIFSLTPAIVTGSIIAAIASQWINTLLYQRLTEKNKPLWNRTIISNAVSLPIDAVIFTLLAFVIFPQILGATSITTTTAISRIISGQTLIKFAIILLMTPLIYLIPEADTIK